MSDSIQSFLYDKEVSLRHAINLNDFQAYCKSNAVLSRKCLAETGKMTEFYSDQSDKDRGVFDRVFGNFNDNGGLFWFADGCPNTYGPITITFKPGVWKLTDDIAICRKNAASRDFDLAKDRLDAPEVEKCFDEDGKLIENGLEVSLGVHSIPCELIKFVVVEPLVDGQLNLVKASFGKTEAKTTPVTRNVQQARIGTETRLEALVGWACELKGDPPDANTLVAPDKLKEWFEQLPSKPALRQWLQYTYAGTLSQLECC